MGVEAGLDCLADVDTNVIDGLYFATVSSPYKEKQAAALIASALDLRTGEQHPDPMPSRFTVMERQRC
jgi:3-hydroxy-3-methylglutaryl CoA synthase